MASMSSLLKSAEATRKRIRQQQDAEIDFEWQLSAKTYEDYQAYAKYLQNRADTITDPTDQLSYRKKINTVRSGYISNEIQRQSINVLEGRATNQQKKDEIVRLFYMAADEGNLDLAQSLRLQIDNLDLRIQSEAESAQALAGKMAALNAKSIDDAVDQLKGYQAELNDIFREKGTDAFTKEMESYAQELGVKPGDFFGMHLRLAQEINGVYDQALASDTDPDNQRKFQKAKNQFNTETAVKLPSQNGRTISVTYQDLVDQADAARTGQTVFRTVQTSEGTVFEKNKETGFVWGRDENGAYRAIQIYNPNTDYTSGIYRTKIDSKGNIVYLDKNDNEVAIKGKDGKIKGLNGKSIDNAAKRDYNDLLKQAGFNVISGQGADYIEIANPGNIPGLASETVRLYVSRDGKLQIAGENDQFFNFNFDEATGEFKGLLKEEPSSLTLLSDQFSADFINKLDRSKLSAGAVGVFDMDLANSRLSSTTLLEGAEFTRQDIYEKQQAEQLRIAQEESARMAAERASQEIGRAHV